MNKKVYKKKDTLKHSTEKKCISTTLKILMQYKNMNHTDILSTGYSFS